MTEFALVERSLVILGASMGAGITGAMFGLGGGIVIVPVLTLFLKIDIRSALGASVISVLANSCSSSPAYLRHGLSNLRLAFFLEPWNALGALSGAFLVGILEDRSLFGIYGTVLFFAMGATILHPRNMEIRQFYAPKNLWAERMKLSGSFEENGKQKAYVVNRLSLGSFLFYWAGMIGGLLGSGAGMINVPALHLVMKIPYKVAVATSTLIIGITATMTASVFLFRGEIDPRIAGPVVLGVILGTAIGSRLLRKLPSSILKFAFIGVMFWVSLQMLYKAVK